MWAPPRRAVSGTAPAAVAQAESPSPLQLLLQLGVPRHRALKALAATGNKSVQLASDWLLTHVNDTTLDCETPREYILYACPVGKFSEQLSNFWTKSRDVCGWNGAHNFIPHITLVSFFKAPDECSLQLSKVLKQVIETVGDPPDNFVNLEPYISPNFMGLFVSDGHAEYFKNIAVQYVKQVSSTIGLTVDTYEQLDALATCFPWCAVPQEPPQPSICLEPHVKSLHITLAYQFPANTFSTLKNLAEDLQPLEKASWEMRLYSRDPRLSNHHVYKVKHVYASRENDELELRLGDYVYIDENVVKNSSDGWVQGISWLTGMTGYLPINYTERTAESDAWTLHKAIHLGKPDPSFVDEKLLPSMASSDESLCNISSKLDNPSSEGDSDAPKINYNQDINEWSISASVMSMLEQTHLKDTKNGSEDFTPTNNDSRTDFAESIDECDQASNTRDVLVMRHGERVDFTFGSWIPYCFDDDDNYMRRDLNMPSTIPKRSGGKLAYLVDCPLTMVGLLQARLVGENLKSSNVKLTQIYSSPSYRCVQTAQAMLDGLEAPKSLKIKIEPSLFEWMIWYSKGHPNWMTVEELEAANLNVDLTYKPLMNPDDPVFLPMEKETDCPEDCDQFYERNGRLVKHVLEDTKSSGGTIMLVGHAITLDTIWRSLSGSGSRDTNTLGHLMRDVPYCSVISMRGPPWQLMPPPSLPMMNTSNKRFDWKVLKD